MLPWGRFEHFCAHGPSEILRLNKLVPFDGEQNCRAKEIKLPSIVIKRYDFLRLHCLNRIIALVAIALYLYTYQDFIRVAILLLELLSV